MKVLVLALSVPLVLSFWPALKFWRHIRALLSSIVLIVLLFGAWDVFAASRGHWFFDPQGTWSFRIMNLPVEEWLFFMVIPFCCIFTWEALNYLKGKMK